MLRVREANEDDRIDLERALDLGLKLTDEGHEDPWAEVRRITGWEQATFAGGNASLLVAVVNSALEEERSKTGLREWVLADYWSGGDKAVWLRDKPVPFAEIRPEDVPY